MRSINLHLEYFIYSFIIFLHRQVCMNLVATQAYISAGRRPLNTIGSSKTNEKIANKN